MSVEAALAQHLEAPIGRGHTPAGHVTGTAGCGAAIAAGSAVVNLVRGGRLLAAARLGVDDIARELGGLSPAKRHVAELAADALHRALGLAARTQAQLLATAE